MQSKKQWPPIDWLRACETSRPWGVEKCQCEKRHAFISWKDTREGASVTRCCEEWPRRAFTAQEMDRLEFDVAEEEKGG